MGTPAYMSPEKCRGSKRHWRAGGCHALGVILFEMLTGRAPFVAVEPGDYLAIPCSRHASAVGLRAEPAAAAH